MGVIVAIIGVCIPIVAILGNYVSEYQKAKLEAGNGIPSQKVLELEKKIDAVLAENHDLKKRLVNVEMIVTDESFQVALPPKNEEDELRVKIEELMKLKNKQ
ncbi:MAG: hypothetical protein ACI85I_001451 [Arenicella sp.]|jgi:hypothetical protein